MKRSIGSLWAKAIVVVLVSGCGIPILVPRTEDDEPPPLLEISNLTATSECSAYLNTSTITFAPTLSGSSSQQSGWKMITVLKEGESASADCKSGDKEYQGTGSYYWSGLKCGTKYSLRSCALRTADGYQSAGITRTITTATK